LPGPQIIRATTITRRISQKPISKKFISLLSE
jgi:hypothetical protein